jgi:hypothetical protein
MTMRINLSNKSNHPTVRRIGIFVYLILLRQLAPKCIEEGQ